MEKKNALSCFLFGFFPLYVEYMYRFLVASRRAIPETFQVLIQLATYWDADRRKRKNSRDRKAYHGENVFYY